MKLLTPGKDGELVLDFDDVVQRGMTVVRDGEKTWPPPPVRSRRSPAARLPRRWRRRSRRLQPMTTRRPQGGLGHRRRALFALVNARSRRTGLILQHFTVFALAIVIGYYVIGHVHHALHTPLMSVTNAISGIIVVGALLQIGHDDAVITGLATVAILLASINVFGGFAVTRACSRCSREGTDDDITSITPARGVHRRRAALHPVACGPVQARDRQGRQLTFGMAAWPSPWSPPSARVDRDISGSGRPRPAGSRPWSSAPRSACGARGSSR
jgi:hypothetical protein